MMLPYNIKNNGSQCILDKTRSNNKEKQELIIVVEVSTHMQTRRQGQSGTVRLQSVVGSFVYFSL